MPTVHECTLGLHETVMYTEPEYTNPGSSECTLSLHTGLEIVVLGSAAFGGSVA